MNAPSSPPELNLSIVRIAVSHRKMVWGMMLGVVCYFVFGVGVKWYGLQPAMAFPRLLFVLALFAYLAVWVFRLARELYGRLVGFACATLLCIAPLSLLILLILNFRAVSVLVRLGYRVGFLGMSSRELDTMKCRFNPLWG